MKKYFVVETDEIIEFGDVVSLTFNKEIEGGKVTVEKEIEFNENTMDLLIEEGIIEEREAEDKESNALIDFEDEPCEALAALEEDFETLEKRVDDMEDVLREIYEIIKTSAAEGKKEEKKNAQPKKK